MFSPSSLDRQLTVTWAAARSDRRRGRDRRRQTALRPLRERLVRVAR